MFTTHNDALCTGDWPPKPGVIRWAVGEVARLRQAGEHNEARALIRLMDEGYDGDNRTAAAELTARMEGKMSTNKPKPVAWMVKAHNPGGRPAGASPDVVQVAVVVGAAVPTVRVVRAGQPLRDLSVVGAESEAAALIMAATVARGEPDNTQALRRAADALGVESTTVEEPDRDAIAAAEQARAAAVQEATRLRVQVSTLEAARDEAVGQLRDALRAHAGDDVGQWGAQQVVGEAVALMTAGLAAADDRDEALAECDRLSKGVTALREALGSDDGETAYITARRLRAERDQFAAQLDVVRGRLAPYGLHSNLREMMDGVCARLDDLERARNELGGPGSVAMAARIVRSSRDHLRDACDAAAEACGVAVAAQVPEAWRLLAADRDRLAQHLASAEAALGETQGAAVERVVAPLRAVLTGYADSPAGEVVDHVATLLGEVRRVGAMARDLVGLQCGEMEALRRAVGIINASPALARTRDPMTHDGLASLVRHGAVVGDQIHLVDEADAVCDVLVSLGLGVKDYRGAVWTPDDSDCPGYWPITIVEAAS